jgi:hypothetical protein
MVLMQLDREDILELLDDDENITHFMAEIAKDEEFEDIVYGPEKPIEYKFRTHFANIQVTPGEKYYGRVAIITDKKGLYTWSEIDLTIATDRDEYSILEEQPQLRQPLDIRFEFDNDEIPYSAFTIHLTESTRRENVGHIATTYLVLDENNQVKFKSEYDKDNLRSIFVSTLLPENKVYKVLAMQHYANNDSSMFATSLIYIPRSKYTKYVPKDSDGTGTYNNDDKLRIEFTIPDNTKGILEIIKDGTVVYRDDDTTLYEEDNPTYDSNGMILTRIKSDTDSSSEQWTYRIFVKFGKYAQHTSEAGFTYKLPAKLG